MSDALAIGVDVGGTKIAAVLTDANGRVLADHTLPTEASEGVERVLDRIAEAAGAVLAHAPGAVRGVGIGCPGPVDPRTGMAGYAVNMGPGWRDVPLETAVRDRLGGDLPVWAANDVNAGALGELLFGAARGCPDFVYVMLGTGLGGGAVIDGRLLHGVTFSAMELGHITVYPDGRPGDFGLRGTTEMYASGKGFLAAVTEYAPAYPDSMLARLATPTPGAILKAAADGDPLARRIIDEAADALGTALAWAITILNPALVVIGGGGGGGGPPRGGGGGGGGGAPPGGGAGGRAGGGPE